MPEIQTVRWGSYGGYEGPYCPGLMKIPVADPDSPLEYKIASVIGATEGGHYDAVNMYDRCILTVGYNQWCDAGMFQAQWLLGYGCGLFFQFGIGFAAGHNGSIDAHIQCGF